MGKHEDDESFCLDLSTEELPPAYKAVLSKKIIIIIAVSVLSIGTAAALIIFFGGFFTSDSTGDVLIPIDDSGIASFTYYTSYPSCCCGQNGTNISPTCDPLAPTDECDDYSGCDYIGDFAALGHRSLDFVETHNLIAFFDASDPSGEYFFENYANKTIEITKYFNGTLYIFNCTIVDTCSDLDCGGCCSQNAQPSGYLVDMEYYTVMNNFGTTKAVGGTVNFTIF